MAIELGVVGSGCPKACTTAVFLKPLKLNQLFPRILLYLGLVDSGDSFSRLHRLLRLLLGVRRVVAIVLRFVIAADRVGSESFFLLRSALSLAINRMGLVGRVGS